MLQTQERDGRRTHSGDLRPGIPAGIWLGCETVWGRNALLSKLSQLAVLEAISAPACCAARRYAATASALLLCGVSCCGEDCVLGARCPRMEGMRLYPHLRPTQSCTSVRPRWKHGLRWVLGTMRLGMLLSLRPIGPTTPPPCSSAGHTGPASLAKHHIFTRQSRRQHG